ncbi:MAG: hypothetical protein AAFQ68_25585, partial [Bacteroidota bacterium]
MKISSFTFTLLWGWVMFLNPQFSYSQCTGNSPTAHFPFDSHFQDISGNENHGITEGREPTSLPRFVPDRFGNPQSAAFFDGNDDYIQFENQ